MNRTEIRIAVERVGLEVENMVALMGHKITESNGTTQKQIIIKIEKFLSQVRNAVQVHFNGIGVEHRQVFLARKNLPMSHQCDFIVMGV